MANSEGLDYSMDMTKDRLRVLAWGLSAIVSIVAFVAWGNLYNWNFSQVDNYFLFPLFGLLAFGLMWVHYVVGAVRRYFGINKKVLAKYFDATSAVVLALILMHPGLLIWQLWQDGHGLPPESYKEYVGPALYGAVIFGTIALVIFLLYEFRRLFGNAKWWRLLQYASDGAMMLIFVHGLRLGAVINSGWLKTIWFFYGFTFLVALLYSRSKDKKTDDTIA